MKRLLTALLMLSLASTAMARSWYASPGGTSVNGASWSDTCSLNTANAGAVEGDFVYLYKGTYTDSIAPRRAGSALNGKIQYSGGHGTGTSSVAGVSFIMPYITASDVTSRSSVTFKAVHDSLTDCAITGTLNADLYGDYFSALRVTTTSDTLREMNFGGTSFNNYLVGGRLDSCTFTLRKTESTTSAAGVVFRNCDQIAVTSCDFNVTVGQSAGNGIFKQYKCKSGVWTDNTFDFYSDNPWTSGDEVNRSDLMRDSCVNNRFLRCYWTFDGTNPYQFFLTSSGNDGAGQPHSCRNNTLYDCSWRSEAPFDYSAMLSFQGGACNDTMAYCTAIAAFSPVLGFGEDVSLDSLALLHNTFITIAPDTITDNGATRHVITSEDPTGTPAAISDNIFYAVPTSYAISGAATAAWTGSGIATGVWTGDYNCWYGDNPADSLIYVGGLPCDTTTCLPTTHGIEANSVWGSPLFAGGTPTVATVMSFDARLSAASPAIGKGSGGSDIGAEAYAVLADSFTVTYVAGDNGSITCDSCNVDGDGNHYVTIALDECGLQVTASADPTYHFVEWDDYRADSTRFDCYLTRDTTFTATFVIDTVTVQYSAGTGGTISGTAYQRVAYGGDATAVTAVPGTGYHFVRWMPDSLWTAARTDTSCVADTAFSAVFGLNLYCWTYAAGTGGTVGPSDRNPQYVLYGSGPEDITASASPGYHFVSWDDGVADSIRGASTPDTCYSDSTVTATFARDTLTLTYTAGTGGTISGTATQLVYYGSSGTTVTAVPSSGYGFYSWSDSVKTAARRDTLVYASVAVSAIFNSIASPAGTAGISLSGSTTMSSTTHSITIASTGTDSLHVYSVTLYHRLRGVLRAVSCTTTPGTAAVDAGETQAVTFTGIRYRWREYPDYRVVVTSDAGTATLDLTYDPC